MKLKFVDACTVESMLYHICIKFLDLLGMQMLPSLVLMQLLNSDWEISALAQNSLELDHSNNVFIFISAIQDNNSRLYILQNDYYSKLS